MEHTVKIRILLGLNLQFASKLNYEKDIYNKLKYDKQIVEIKKDIIYEKDYKSQCIVIIAVQLEREQIEIFKR